MVLHFCPGVLSSLLAPRWQLVSDWSPHPRYSHLLLISSDCSSQYLGPWWKTVPRWIVILTSVSVANFFVFPVSLLTAVSISLYRSTWVLACFPWTWPGWAWVRVSHCMGSDWVCLCHSGTKRSVSLLSPALDPFFGTPGALIPWSLYIYIYIHNSRGVVNKCPFDCIALNPA